jgi:hypothetical protein
MEERMRALEKAFQVTKSGAVANIAELSGN